jgi:hypothetical protein
MPVCCQICGQEFTKQITNSHLKRHSITTADYKKQFGDDSLSSPEYREQKRQAISGSNNPMFGRSQTEESRRVMSERRSGKPAHNKGAVLTDAQKDKLRVLALERNAQWAENGDHPLLGRKHSDETKELIRQKRAEQIISSEACQRAAITRKERGYQAPMLGKHHSEETKAKILVSMTGYRQKVKERTHQKRLDAIASLNLRLIDHDDHFMHLECLCCGHHFHRTPQVFDPCRIRVDMCDVCHPKINYTSKAETEICEYIKGLLPDIEVRSRDKYVIGRGELDIYIPSMRLAIEYNGLYWHSEIAGKSRDYHLNKLEKCTKKGIRLITIFEDEYMEKPHIVRSRLASLLGKSAFVLGARECDIVELSSAEANSFLKEHHIQGSGRSNVRYGLMYDNELLSVMTFSKDNLSRKINDWELNRFASKTDWNIAGAASRLFKRFIRDHNPKQIVTYADKRWSEGNLYHHLGFVMSRDTEPNYWYIDGLRRIHRFALRKNDQDDPNMTEWENRKAQGWNRIWDCGSIRFDWNAI